MYEDGGGDTVGTIGTCGGFKDGYFGGNIIGESGLFVGGNGNILGYNRGG